MQQFDVVVIGAGSGGLTSAVGLAKIGKRVLLIEREHIGGECTNSGCIPSKALLHYAKSYAAAVVISGDNGPTEDYRRQAFSYVRRIITETLAAETPAHFESLGITVVSGEASFSSPRTITVNQTSYKFTQAIIATGSSPRLVTIPGLRESDTLTNKNLFTVPDIPKRTLIIGGGPIGLEMGQALALLGSTVTIVDTGSHLGKLEDSSVAAVIQAEFAQLPITFIGNATVAAVEGKLATVSVGESGMLQSIPFDKVLMAIGRVPNLPNGLSTANVSVTELGITVDHNYQTSNRRIYALGDVAESFKFTHQADDVGRQVVTRIATKGIVTIKTKALPKVTYTQPELAQVGMSQTEAEITYGKLGFHRIEVPFTASDRARTDNTETGILVVLVKRLSGKILGAHIAGERAGELIAIFTLALDNNLSLWKLRRTIYAYPTYALIIKKAGDYFFATQVKTLKGDVAAQVKRWVPKTVLAVFWLSAVVILYRYQVESGQSVTDTALELFTLATNTAWGPLLYILAYGLSPIIFLPGTALTILSGVFFGLWGGLVYTILGANLAATVAYTIGRLFGGKLNQANPSFLGHFAATCRSKPFTAVLSMRLLFFPFDVVNYGAGLIKIPYLPYITATIIGTLLGIATFVSIGASISVEEFRANGISTDVINSTFLILSAAVFISSLGMARLLKKK